MELLELRKLIEHLDQRRQLLTTAIDDLERLCSGEPAPVLKRPGRKSVNVEERRQISERMKARWAVRKLSKVSVSGG